MAHFAKLGINGKVIAVHGLDNDKMLNADGVEDERVGQQELQRIHGWPAELWIQTSYNTRSNKYWNSDGTEAADQSQAFRGNYAGIGFTWDEDNEIFWPKSPYASYVKNTTTAEWDAPVAKPSSFTVQVDGVDVELAGDWDEPNLRWVGLDPNYSGDNLYTHYWNPDSSTWVAV